MNKITYINDEKAMVSKKFEKNASVYGTPEFKLWREYKKEFPNAVMTTKSIKKNPDKRTNKNLKYENMRLFIKEQDNAEELLKEFEREIRLSKIQSNPYRAVLAWFLQKFGNYDSYKQFFKDLEEKEKAETTNINIEENMPSAANM